MSNLQAFMIEKKEEVFEYVASKNFKDENGKPIPWKLKTITAKENEDLRKQFELDATSKVKLRLVLEAIANKENLEADDAAVNDEYQRIADQYQMELERIKELIPTESLKYDVRIRKALDFVKDSAIK